MPCLSLWSMTGDFALGSRGGSRYPNERTDPKMRLLSMTPRRYTHEYNKMYLEKSGWRRWLCLVLVGLGDGDGGRPELALLSGSYEEVVRRNSGGELRHRW